MPIGLTLGRPKQEDCQQFRVSLVFIVHSTLLGLQCENLFQAMTTRESIITHRLCNLSLSFIMKIENSRISKLYKFYENRSPQYSTQGFLMYMDVVGRLFMRTY